MQRRKISLLLILILMQPRMCFLGYKCAVMNTLSFLWKAALTLLCPARICAQECPVLGGGPYTWPCSSRVLHTHTPQAFQGPFWMSFFPSSVLRVPHGTPGVHGELANECPQPHLADKCWAVPVPILTSEGHHSSFGCLLSAWISRYCLWFFLCSYPVNSLSIQ